MSRAGVLVLPRPPYHGDRMGAALERLGYGVTFAPLLSPRPGDLLVTWNRHASRDGPAQAHERAGGTVIVVENGYFGRNWRGAEWYAMALGQHNGAGRWPPGDEGRWQSFGVQPHPWRDDGDEIVILAQRGMGSAICREPKRWPEHAAQVLRGRTRRPVRVRRHPGGQKTAPALPIEDDLRNAWAAVTWGSAAGIRAIVAGVPVFHGLPSWIGAPAARPLSHDLDDPFLGDRKPMLARLATAMWSLPEIESGEAFRAVLGVSE